MPAYSFKEQFCPFVLDGTKPHTIRSYRKYPVLPGQALSLFYGMRTKHCTLLRNETCTEVKTIAITESGTVVLVECARLELAEVEGLKTALVAADYLIRICPLPKEQVYNYDHAYNRPSRPLTDAEKDVLAWKDGFRPEGSSLHNPAGAFALMMDFWRDSHDFPFVGNIIYWDPFKKLNHENGYN
jgi:hypothetical protein